MLVNKNIHIRIISQKKFCHGVKAFLDRMTNQGIQIQNIKRTYQTLNRRCLSCLGASSGVVMEFSHCLTRGRVLG